MPLWYSNFRVVRLPSSPATRTLTHALLPRNFQVDSGRFSPSTAHVLSVRWRLGPARRPTPPAKGVPVCTGELLKSEASRPKKGRRTSCVAAGRKDREVGRALDSVYACAELWVRRGREELDRGSSVDWVTHLLC